MNAATNAVAAFSCRLWAYKQPIGLLVLLFAFVWIAGQFPNSHAPLVWFFAGLVSFFIAVLEVRDLIGHDAGSFLKLIRHGTAFLYIILRAALGVAAAYVSWTKNFPDLKDDYARASAAIGAGLLTEAVTRSQWIIPTQAPVGIANILEIVRNPLLASVEREHAEWKTALEKDVDAMTPPRDFEEIFDETRSRLKLIRFKGRELQEYVAVDHSRAWAAEKKEIESIGADAPKVIARKNRQRVRELAVLVWRDRGLEFLKSVLDGPYPKLTDLMERVKA